MAQGMLPTMAKGLVTTSWLSCQNALPAVVDAAVNLNDPVTAPCPKRPLPVLPQQITSPDTCSTQAWPGPVPMETPLVVPAMAVGVVR